MTAWNRREFIVTAMGTATAALGENLPVKRSGKGQDGPPFKTPPAQGEPQSADADRLPVDFRYSPLSYQTAFCFPDDPYKSIVGEGGELYYGFDRMAPITGISPFADFADAVEFSVQGMDTDRVVAQQLEAPGVPIVHTFIERAAFRMELVTFATNRKNEGRVDNVLMTVVPQRDEVIHVGPRVSISSRKRYTLKAVSSPEFSPCTIRGQHAVGVCGLPILISNDSPESPLFMVVNPLSGKSFGAQQGIEHEITVLAFHPQPATVAEPFRCLFRFPQEKQTYEQLAAATSDPYGLLEEARSYWAASTTCQSPVEWNLHGKQEEFLTACARNILQARELKEGKLTFQVGPTVYRGLWILDGNFLLEAARYLGYDKEAEEGLRSTWSRQQADGMVLGGGGNQHWKDSAIAIFSLIRQAELSQDWSLFHELKPNVLNAVSFLTQVRERGLQASDSPNGRYGLLVEGFGDGGLAFGSEITNTLWTLAGLKSLVKVVQQRNLKGYESAEVLYKQLSSGLAECIKNEMRQAPEGFSYLPMLLKSDRQWSLPDEWDRPRPQAAQWALSHSIYPGLLFSPDDQVVRGHAALMQACTREEIPADTGWNSHEAVWTYNAPFVAQVYLWLGMRDLAQRTFTGFLNHASPLYCWREEQPLREGLNGTYFGDMPHNWASAECIRFLRHMLALEDGNNLRLLAAITSAELVRGKPFGITQSPTRFGRVSLSVEPLDRGRGWRLAYQRGSGPPPARIEVPAMLGWYRVSRVEGGTMQSHNGHLDGIVQMSPEQDRWTVYWEG